MGTRDRQRKLSVGGSMIEKNRGVERSGCLGMMEDMLPASRSEASPYAYL